MELLGKQQGDGSNKITRISGSSFTIVPEVGNLLIESTANACNFTFQPSGWEDGQRVTIKTPKANFTGTIKSTEGITNVNGAVDSNGIVTHAGARISVFQYLSGQWYWIEYRDLFVVEAVSRDTFALVDRGAGNFTQKAIADCVTLQFTTTGDKSVSFDNSWKPGQRVTIRNLVDGGKVQMIGKIFILESGATDTLITATDKGTLLLEVQTNGFFRILGTY